MTVDRLLRISHLMIPLQKTISHSSKCVGLHKKWENAFSRHLPDNSEHVGQRRQEMKYLNSWCQRQPIISLEFATIFRRFQVLYLGIDKIFGHDHCGLNMIQEEKKH